MSRHHAVPSSPQVRLFDYEFPLKVQAPIYAMRLRGRVKCASNSFSSPCREGGL